MVSNITDIKYSKFALGRNIEYNANIESCDRLKENVHEGFIQEKK